jgi:Vacuolar sorting protein 9 (VPS9) domain
VDSDTFLSILIYCLVQRNNPAFLAHTHLIDAVLPSNISYEMEEMSYVWITVCAALDQLKRDKYTQYDACIESVIKEKLADSITAR